MSLILCIMKSFVRYESKILISWFGNIGQYKTGKKLELWKFFIRRSRPLIVIVQSLTHNSNISSRSQRDSTFNKVTKFSSLHEKELQMKHIMTTLFGCIMIMVQLKNVKS